MADEFLFGWFVGLMTITLPYLTLTILRLRKQLKRLNPVKDLEKEASWKKKIPRIPFFK